MIKTKRTLGPYTLHRLIGRGGMSSVYEATDERMRRRVAIKVMTTPPDLTESAEQAYLHRFRREARAAARLSHPNVVFVYDVGEEGDDHYLVMEYLDGLTLAQWLAENGPLLSPDAAVVLDQIAAGLDAIHAAGIVHRDLKPSNVMLTDLESGRPRVRILDFGVARPTDATTMTQVGALIGTPAYLAPELAQGATTAASADLWALGVMAYEMLTGRSPFPGDRLPAVVYRIVHEPPDPAPELPPAVREVLWRALAKDPTERFASGQAFAGALRQALATPVTAPTPTEMSESRTLMGTPLVSARSRTALARSRRFAPWSIALAVLLLLGLVFALFRMNGRAGSVTGPSGSTDPSLPVLNPPPMALPRDPEPKKPTPTPATTRTTSKQSTRSTQSTALAGKERVRKRDQARVAARVAVATPAVPKRRVPKPTPRPVPPVVTITRSPVVTVAQATPRPPRPTPRPTPRTPRVALLSTPRPTPLVGFVMPDPTPRPTSRPTPPLSTPAPLPSSESPVSGKKTSEDAIADTAAPTPDSFISDEELLGDLEGFVKAWIEASEKRDVAWMMEFYPEQLDRYYTLVDVPFEHVRRDKERIFSRARRVEMRIRNLRITLSPDRRGATLRYRKDYRITGGPGEREGAVEEELRVRRDDPDEDWKILYERNPRVLSR
ncbi:MAG: serine/threonine-protein kinase [Capsulimonadales bacterium]|nr:serine/threonine-protein kinase [Capsulimonadales bacterium]